MGLRHLVRLLGAIALTYAVSAVAQTITDADTGLSLVPPSGYSVSDRQSRRNGFSIKLASNDDADNYCHVNFGKALLDAAQTASNVQNWNDRFRRYPVEETSFWKIPADRSKIVSTNFDENYPLKRPEQSYGHSVSVYFKTSDGLLSVHCEAGGRDINKLRPLLEAIVRGISFPK